MYNIYMNKNQFKGNPQIQEMLMGNKTSPIIKWIVIGIFGILPFILLIWLVGPEIGSISVDNWRRSDYLVTISYGMMWVAGIITVILCSIVVSFIAMLTRDVKNDVIPLTVGFLFIGLGFYVIPLAQWYSLFFILIAPILFFIGATLGTIGVFLVMIKKMSGEIQKMQQDPEVKKQMEEIEKQMQQGQNPFGQEQNKNNNKSKDKEENYQDNPFVDIEPEDKEDKK